MQYLDIIIPVKNEAHALLQLVLRLHKTLTKANIRYTLIFVDDRSTDATVAQIQKLSKSYPIKLVHKQGKPGKAFSILEGAAVATQEFVVMLDADLQYPPEAIPQMLQKTPEHAVVVANRRIYKNTWFRRIASRSNAFIFGKLLFGLQHDVQSGLKLFKREIIEHIDRSVISPWAFDIPLLFTALELGYTIGSVDITFEKRGGGTSKIRFLEVAGQIASSALRLRLKKSKKYIVPPKTKHEMRGAGIVHRRKRFITHTTLSHGQSALETLSFWQKFTLSFILGICVGGLILNTLTTVIVLVALLSTIYFLDVLFSFYLVIKSLHFPPEISVDSAELAELSASKLPVYSILCPLYREAHVLPQFVDSISKLDWPKQKLDVLLLLEEDDQETITAAKKMNLPSYMRIVVVPHSDPKTKPKACNYGLSQAKGEYIVVYDAEDIPEASQLKVAYAAFQKLPRTVLCLQAKLNYYNPHRNLLTRLFTTEYSLWFDVILPGLQSIEATIPLGGTSNHFRTADLKRLHGWDAFNVTEDCDLGVRLFREGYKTAIIDSTTLEEANSRYINWLRQRSRWLKGYLQTYFVHMRHPLGFIKDHGVHAFIFQLVVGGKITFMLINPVLWLLTISYFVLYKYVGPTIESIYPASVFYMAAFSLVAGNFLYLYNYMLGSAKRRHWELIKYVFLIPFYWLMVSVAAAMAVIQLIFKPHYWEKTNHGFHLSPEVKVKHPEPAASPVVSVIPRRFSFTALALIVSSIIGNVLHFLYNAYLGRVLDPSQFGLVSVMGSLVYLAQVPFGSLGKTVTFKSGFLFGKHHEPAKQFWRMTRERVAKVALVCTGIWLISIPLLMNFFQAPFVPFMLFSPVWIMGLLSAVDVGFLSGTQHFFALGIILLIEASAKLLVAFGFVQLGLTDFLYSAIPISMFCTFLAAWLVSAWKPEPKKQTQLPTFPRKFFLTSVMEKISIAAYLSFDLILAKHYLSAQVAGEYALLSLVGKMIFFVSNLTSQFVVPVISKAEGQGKDTEGLFYKLLTITIVTTGAAFVAVGLLGHLSVPLLLGSRSLAILSYLPLYTLGMTYFSIATAIITYHQTKHNFAFSALGFLVAALQVTLLLFFHENLQQFTWVLFVTGTFWVWRR